MKHILILLLIASACWGQTFRATRPRVLFNSTELTAIQAKMTGTAAEQAQWTALTTYNTSFCNASVTTGASKQPCVWHMAMAYAMDPTTYGGAFATKACALLKYTVDRDDGDIYGWLDADSDISNGNSFRWYGSQIAFAWDKLQPHCDSVDATVGTKVRYTAERAWEIMKPDSTYPNGKFSFLQSATSAWRINNNIGIGQVETMLKFAAAAYDPSTYTTPQTWLPTIVSAVMTPYVVPSLINTTAANSTEIGYGGSWSEGIAEYAGESMTRMYDLIDSWRVATTDTDYWASVGPTFPRYIADFTFRGTSPTGATGTYYTLYQPYLLRDVTALGGISYALQNWFMHRQALLRMNKYFRDNSDTDYIAWSEYYLKNIQPAYYPRNAPAQQNSGFEVERLVFEDPNATGTDYRTESYSHDHTTPFMLLARSGWDANATWAGFIAMIEGGDHMHGDAGSFNIYRKGKWLTREIPGYFNNRHVNGNSSHNSLTLNGHGSFTGAYRSGGSTPGVSTPAKFKARSGGHQVYCGDVFCAAEADVSNPYKFTGYLITADVDTVQRSFFYLKPDIFVVSDRIKYTTGVTARSIFHVQSEKVAAAISSNMATISNANQRLHVHKAFPSTADFLTPLQTTVKIVDIHLRNDNQAAFYFDGIGSGSIGHPASAAYTVSGFTGDYSVINGSRTFTLQSGSSGLEPFSDGVAYSGERLLLNSTGLFAGLPEYDPEQHGYGQINLTKDMRWTDPDINPTSPGTIVTHLPYRLDIHSGRKVNEESFLVVMQGADSTDTPMTVATLTSTTSNATGAAFTPPGGTLTEVIAPTLTTPTFPMSITRTGDPANHYVLGMTPGTTYKVSDTGGVTTINTSGAGTSVVANNAGILNYQVDASISSPSITLVATPASLTASCVNGGSNPADQTIALTVTGDGGEAAISFSDDSAAISETLSGGAAPQNTPQTMTVAFGGCSGLSVGVHNLNISVTSGTTYVVNSPLTIPVTVTVTTNPLIAASPASVEFTATVSGSNPVDQTVTISRTVSGDLGTITDDAAWLTVSPTTATGITSQDLTLSVDIAGLAAGQHTATITVVSAGASNTPITIPVLLALDNPPQIGLEPRPGTTMIQIPFMAPSRAACTIRACTTAACSSVVASASDGGGHPIRIYTLTGLTAATTYTVQTVCGTEIKARQVTTRAATGGPTITLPIDVYNAVGADNIVVDYGADDTLSETAVNGSCSASRCTATITWTNAFRLLWFQITYRDSGNNVLKTEAIRSRSLIPE